MTDVNIEQVLKYFLENSNTFITTSKSDVLVDAFNLTTTWQRFTFTGTLGSGMGDLGFYVYSGAHSGTAGADDSMYFTGFQLEKGTVATDYEWRPFATELLLCQRYYEKSYDYSTAPGTATSNNPCYSRNDASNATTTRNFVVSGGRFAVEKRTSPSVTFYSSYTGTASRISGYSSGTDYTVTSHSNYSTKGLGYLTTSTSPATNETSAFHYTADAEI